MDDQLYIIGAHEHNLKHVDLSIPKHQFVVITGVSGSGKSTLAFDTLFVEGQRRFIESLSPYVRQYLGKIQKPKVVAIEGLCPSIAIAQKYTTTNTRSTVGSLTQIDDFLRNLYACIGQIISPVTGKIVQPQTSASVLEAIRALPEHTRFYILSDILRNEFLEMRKRGERPEIFDRFVYQGQVVNWDDLPAKLTGRLFALVDRYVVQPVMDETRLLQSVQIALDQQTKTCVIAILATDGKISDYHFFHQELEEDGIRFVLPSEHLFSPNNPIGACVNCNASGRVTDYSMHLCLPHQHECLSGQLLSMLDPFDCQSVIKQFKEQAIIAGFDPDLPFDRYPIHLQRAFWFGKNGFVGFLPFLY